MRKEEDNMKKFRLISWIVLITVSFLYPVFGAGGEEEGTPASARMKSWENHIRMRDASVFRGLHWQSLGPRFQGGRVETIDAVPGTSTIYVGFGAGNVWKTVNNGLTWTPVFEHQPVFAIGDLAVAPSDPNVVWVGTGENLLARSSFAGVGVFKSTDGGQTWSHMGLEETHHIGRVAVDPRNPDIVYVAALGHEYTTNKERGLYKTTDGGRTWVKALYVSERAGVADVVLDPSDPDTVYASSEVHIRRAWNAVGTGKGAGLFKSTDGGKTWASLTNGLPKGDKIGRIALAVSRSDPRIVYAFIINQTPVKRKDDKGKVRSVPTGPEVYRSEDKGTTWKKMPMASDRFALHSYGDIRVSPDNPDVFYALGVNLVRSKDGGQNFDQVEGTIIHLYKHPARALHLDQHDLWIDPKNPDRLILGNDGGVYISNDRGENWLHLNNIPAGEFYAVSVEDADPYRIYGGTQDDAALFGPSDRVPEDGIQDAWRYVWIDLWGGGDSYVTRVDPTDPDIIYFEQQFGNFQRKNMRTGTISSIRPRIKDAKPPLRYNWMSPFIISHHNPLTLYFGANRLFKSLNRGDGWRVISPDLTTQPGPEKRGNVPYGTITTISESPLRPGLLYVGTDDGRVWMTPNDGVTWTEIGAALPGKWISRVEASRHDEGTVYAALTGYREDDFRTYLYKSADSGKTWVSIAAGLPDEQFNVIREDPKHKDVLYAGSDQGGVYVSKNGGLSWISLCADLPTAAVHDIAVQPRDRELVIATHGRSIFKLDLVPVDRFTEEIAQKEAHLFPTRDARLPRSRDYRGDWAYETAHPAVLHYYLKSGQDAEIQKSSGIKPGAEIQHGAEIKQGVKINQREKIKQDVEINQSVGIRIFDEKGNLVRTLHGPGKAGINTVVWDLRPDGKPPRKGVYEPAVQLVKPGIYTVKIKAGSSGTELEGKIHVREYRDGPRT